MNGDRLAHGRPSAAHEHRVDMLAAMARLAGHVTSIDVLADNARPDVCLIRPGDRSLFIGDAKETESPGNSRTDQRLRRYTSFLGRYVSGGGSGVFALAVPVVERHDWLRLLDDVCAGVPGQGGGRLDVIDVNCVVAWRVFRGPDERIRVTKPVDRGRISTM